MPPEGLGQRVHARLLAEASAAALVDGDLGPTVARLARDESPLLDDATVARLIEDVTAQVRGLGPLDALLADPAVSEVMVNGTGDVWIERHGRLERTALDLRPTQVALLVERIVGPLGLRADRTSPLVDARLADGSRVNAVVPPLAVDGPCLTIRRFGTRLIELADVCPKGVAELLAWAIDGRLNVLVSGGTGAGKTTLLNTLARSIPTGERIVTVEDAAELRLGAAHVVRLEARPANAEGVGEVSVRALVRNALRMRPDRLVVGEVRGAEALDMLQAMNTGHEGSLSTCHANSPVDALRRREVMVSMGSTALPIDVVREHIAAAIDLVIQVARLADGRRQVVEVAEVGTPGDAPGALTVHTLAGLDGLIRVPRRGPRRLGAPRADPAWVVAG